MIESIPEGIWDNLLDAEKEGFDSWLRAWHRLPAEPQTTPLKPGEKKVTARLPPRNGISVNVEGGPVRVVAYFGVPPAGIQVPLGELKGYCRFPIARREDPLAVMVENVGEVPAVVTVVGLASRANHGNGNSSS